MAHRYLRYIGGRFAAMSASRWRRGVLGAAIGHTSGGRPTSPIEWVEVRPRRRDESSTSVAAAEPEMGVTYA